MKVLYAGDYPALHQCEPHTDHPSPAKNMTVLCGCGQIWVASQMIEDPKDRKILRWSFVRLSWYHTKVKRLLKESRSTSVQS